MSYHSRNDYIKREQMDFTEELIGPLPNLISQYAKGEEQLRKIQAINKRNEELFGEEMEPLEPEEDFSEPDPSDVYDAELAVNDYRDLEGRDV